MKSYEPYYRKGKREGHWVKAVEDKRVFDSISMAAREYGVTRQGIIQALGKGCRAGGVHWEDVTLAGHPKNLRSKTPWIKERRKAAGSR